MSLNQVIRLHNLRLLVQEVERAIGKSRGAIAELSRRSGVPSPMISQLLNARLHSSGSPRIMGDATARKLEEGMVKPMGWMDQDHRRARDHEEAADLDRLRSLTPKQRDALRAMMEQMAEANAAAGARLAPGDHPLGNGARH